MLPRILLFLVCVLLSWSCQSPQKAKVPAPGQAFERLSDYGLFEEPLAQLKASNGVLAYNVNTPLFSDYAEKARFVRLPSGTSAHFSSEGAFEFPDGTLVAKNFYYGEGLNKQIVETRILLKTSKGWEAWPYVWNEDQTEAYLEIAGAYRKVSIATPSGESLELDYMVPNKNQCKNCHDWSGNLQPIGLQAKHLDKNLDYGSGEKNQLLHWQELGLLSDYPESESIRLASWEAGAFDQLDLRARSYLDINCGHCHNPKGSAKNSGLNLLFEENNPTSLGINKPPVAAGKGSGGLIYSIVPGQPDASILYYRMHSTDPGAMMPELGRKLQHQEGLALIRKWIEEMEY
jgi:uncharacterized repeat protein (TIGR03806 family)